MVSLKVEDLSIRFGGILALDGVSFSVEKGEILSIIGPNGAGKTTVFNCITRIYEPIKGSIQFKGRDLLRTRPHQMITHGVARTFQNLELFSTMTVLDNLLVGQHASLRYNLLEAVLRLPKALKQENSGSFRAQEVLGCTALQHGPLNVTIKQVAPFVKCIGEPTRRNIFRLAGSPQQFADLLNPIHP